MIVYLVIYIIQGAIFGWAVNKIIENKGYNENWFWWGFFFGFISLIVALTKPEKAKPWEVSGNRGTSMEHPSESYVNHSYDKKRDSQNHDMRSENSSNNVQKEEKKDTLVISIQQYNHAPKLKPRSLTCRPHHEQYAFSIELRCFAERNITAVMADIILHTVFGTIYEIKDIGFSDFEKGKGYRIQSGMTEYPLPQAQFIIIQQADFVIKKYVENGQLVELSEEDMKLSPYEEPLEEELRGIDVDDLISQVENLKNSREIYNFLLEYNAENENGVDNDLMEIIKQCVIIERLYGSTVKGDCIKEIRKYFE